MNNNILMKVKADKALCDFAIPVDDNDELILSGVVVAYCKDLILINMFNEGFLFFNGFTIIPCHIFSEYRIYSLEAEYRDAKIVKYLCRKGFPDSIELQASLAKNLSLLEQQNPLVTINTDFSEKHLKVVTGIILGVNRESVEIFRISNDLDKYDKIKLNFKSILFVTFCSNYEKIFWKTAIITLNIPDYIIDKSKQQLSQSPSDGEITN